MTSFSDVYRSRPFGLTHDQGRLYGRLILLLTTAIFTLSVIAASTELHHALGYAQWEAWKFAGVLSGIAAPLAIFGVFIILPSERSERELALIGGTLTIVGIFLFWMNFPYQWMGDTPNHTFRTTSVYFTGLITTFIAVFISVSNIRINRPGHIVLERIQQTTDTLRGKTTENEPSVEPEPADTPQNSGVGFIGEPDEDVYDGVDDSEILDEETSTSKADPYCGNCTHFSYVRVNGQLQPYCGLHDTQMDNIDACEDWTPEENPL